VSLVGLEAKRRTADGALDALLEAEVAVHLDVVATLVEDAAALSRRLSRALDRMEA
jgi:ribosome maturation factor RimP